MENLWGEISTEKIETPKSILETQAKYLSDATNKKVYAEIERDYINENAEKDDNLRFNFIIRGKYMDNYGYQLLKIATPVDLYPVKIYLDQKTLDEITVKLGDNNFIPFLQYVTADNEKEYIDILRLVLSSKRVKNLITGILSMSSKEQYF